MKPDYELTSFHIIEHFNGNLMFTWTFPSLADSLRDQILARFHLSKDDFIYYRLENHWVYLWHRCAELKTYTLVLIAKTFKPLKYKHFGQEMCHTFESDFKPSNLANVFLSTFINGTYSIRLNGTQSKFNSMEFENCEQLQELIRLFDVEIILIFNALLLKKRLFVYHPNFAVLLKFIEAITNLFDWKVRNPDEYLFPIVRNISLELKGRHFFLVGMTEINRNIKPEFYDLFVNLDKGTLKMSSGSKDVFAMTKWHKDIAALLTESSNEAKMMHDVHEKTSALIAHLKSFASSSTSSSIEPMMMITVEDLRAKKMPLAMENFLFNLAVAENIMML